MQAMYWHALGDNRVQCDLCPHACQPGPGQTGICRVRVNQNGTLVSLNRDRLVAAHLDPVEKKPLYHFYPGAQTFSVAGAGCNFRCTNCQNHTISQANTTMLAAGEPADPVSVVTAAVQSGARHITLTYTEPTVFFELMVETARAAVDAGLQCSMVSNGFINPDPLAELLPLIGAANIDLKFGHDRTYRQVTGGRLAPVVHTIRTLFEAGIITEVTTLVIPGLNDETDTFGPMLDTLLEISPDIPWHLSAFYPTFQMTDRPPTPAATLSRLRAEALRAGMRYVYTGNVLDPEGSATTCPGCGSILVERHRLSLRSCRIRNAACPDCGTRIYGQFA